MQFADNDIYQTVESIWTSVLGMEVRPSNGTGVLPEKDHSLAACVQITGAWEGAVVLHSSTELVRRAAAAMFGVDGESTTAADMQDALGELVNMIGGNLKALLPESCYLSLPTAVEGQEYTLRVPGSLLLNQFAFHCQDQPFLVALLERDGKQG